MNGSYRRQRVLALAGTLAALWPAGAAWSQTAPPFAQLLNQTRDVPRVTVLEADVARARGLAEQARARPNPSINVYAENFAGDLDRNARNQQQTTFQIDQPIELGGKRSARIAAGEAGIVAAQARNRDGRLVYATELARAYAGAEIADRRIAIAEDEVEEATDDLKVARALVGAGKEARLRQVQAETELNTLQADLENARALKTAALARLSALAGITTPFTGLSESLLDRLDAKPAFGPIDPMQATMVRVAEAERDAAARAVTVQQRLAIPNVTAQLGVRQLRVASGPAVVAGISVPLPLFDRNRGNISAARAELQGAEARAAAARLEAEAGTRAGLALVEAADARAAAAQRTLATAQEGYRLARVAYEAGKSPLIELLAARHNLGVARGVILDAAAARLDARANLARLQGLTITGEAVQ
ncbi:outer membrane protein, cobalt-zinc-cadmium efflux system [Sphingomonas sp. OV641]|jgi:cobalt-zinc-cadmium efflux system outer membrane protein|uniref:TolC family protein n=5 Tax=Sphingomonadaceae TaxID=41297 RepID=A0A7Y6EG22_9SPHN|nr:MULTISPECIES: TolC family protein [Sphingomonadaceae]PZU72126.1 MAG: TolC family protein [Rhizobium sp.]MBB4049386.1 cobalt-zinc-cadmium efflux system outer membrane protein [Sphingomonas zeae]NLS27488.1 Nickel and cobalt resistance protein CnrC [Sphingomonas sp. S2M10]NUU46358.1 TolC family protein [Sphingomonas zeae]QPS14764.1 TolC family protein [Sphingomonas paucimobilis]